MIIFDLLNKLTDLVVAPFHGLGAVPQLVLLSLVSTVILLAAFKRLSDQERIKRYKNKIFGNFLEIAIYRDQFRRSLICQGRVLKYNLLYLGAIGKPFLLLMVPMIFVCLQLDYRLGYQPLKVGQSFVIEAQLDTKNNKITSDSINGLNLTTSNSIDVETPPLRIASTGQVFWKARVIQDGPPNFICVSIPNNNETIRKDLAIQETHINRFPPTRSITTNWGDLLISGEDHIPVASPLKMLRVDYAQANYLFFKWSLSPIIYYFILTIIFGLFLKPVMMVDI